MGRAVNEERLREDCAEAGVAADVVEIVVLRQRDDLLFTVIAARLGLKPATVRQAYHRATERLREYYGTPEPLPLPAEAPEPGRLSRRQYARVIYESVQRAAVSDGKGGDPRLPQARRVTLDDVLLICDRAEERRNS